MQMNGRGANTRIFSREVQESKLQLISEADERQRYFCKISRFRSASHRFRGVRFVCQWICDISFTAASFPVFQSYSLFASGANEFSIRKIMGLPPGDFPGRR